MRVAQMVSLGLLAGSLATCSGSATPTRTCVDDGCPISGTTCEPTSGECRCGATADAPVCNPGETCMADLDACIVGGEAICPTPTPWAPGTPAFTEVTDEWGLTAMDVEGVQMTATDIDGDGWPDLVVRRGDSGIDDFSAGGVRSTWVLHNDHGNGFIDVTQASGFVTPRGTTMSRPVSVVVWADVDNDGDLDAYTGIDTSNTDVARGETSELLLNDGHGVFTLAAADNPLRRVGTSDSPGGAAFVDYDRDGLIDLWEPQFSSSSGETTQSILWQGNGTGSFTDVTAAAGLTTQDWVSIATLNLAKGHARAWSALACDLNGDGRPELLAASYGRAPNHLWQADDAPDAHFTNASIASGYAFDGNQIWTDNAYAQCYCQANPTAADCSTVAAPILPCPMANWNHAQDREPFRLGGNSGTTMCADLDNDGDFDLVTTEIKHWWAGSGSDAAEVLVNSGGTNVAFTRPGNATTGLAIDHSDAPYDADMSFDYTGWHEGFITGTLLDFDNDGWNDIYLGGTDYLANRGRLYHQDSPLHFSDLPVADFFEHNRSHGVTVADFDHDGDLDIVVGHSHGRCRADQPNDCYPTQQVRMFRNDVGNGQSFVQLRLEGTGGSNRSAIGATVTVTAGALTQKSQVDGGHGHYGMQNDLVQHFGLAGECYAHVTVRWPDAAGTTQSFWLAAGHRYHVVQGAPPTVEQD